MPRVTLLEFEELARVGIVLLDLIRADLAFMAKQSAQVLLGSVKLGLGSMVKLLELKVGQPVSGGSIRGLVLARQ